MANGFSSRLASLRINVPLRRPIVALRAVWIGLVVGFNVRSLFRRVGFDVVSA